MKGSLRSIEFTVEEVLYKSNRTKIISALLPDNLKKVIIKQLTNKFPSDHEIDQLTQEYHIVNNLSDLPEIGKYELIRQGNRPMLMMDSFDGITLSSFIHQSNLSLESKLALAIKICDLLNAIHERKIVHRDINPSNILWNEITEQIRIIDFGLAFQVSHDMNEIMADRHFGGTLQYISPEQTGRINIPVDTRSDLYSLGVLLYEIFTGTLPFKGDDRIELVHSHIAKSPQPLYDVIPEIPKPISDIVLKLLAKNPDERYQTAHGLKSDLDVCLQQLKIEGSITRINMGENDYDGKFHLTQKLYGRQNEIHALVNAFEKVVGGGNELMVVTGSSGSGKSMLVSNLQEPVLKKNGFFAQGKYDRFKKDVPLSAFADAFSEIISEILSSSQQKLNHWKDTLNESLGPNGKLISNLIPELEKITGNLPDIQSLNPAEAQNRFIMLLRNFIKAIATKDHPLVIVLDDIQWCDPVSLRLIQTLVTHKISYLMLVCVYRISSEENGHMPGLVFEEIAKIRNYETLEISNLTPEATKQIISDSLRYYGKESDELASIFYRKTKGNPFFIKELLKTLYKDKLLWFNTGKKTWEWDNDKILQAQIPDNLVEVLNYRIKNIPKETIEILKIASCIGNTFELEAISTIINEPPQTVVHLLNMALNEGIIYMLGAGGQTEARIEYGFHHYRIQKIIQSLINEVELIKYHVQIGYYMLQQKSESEIDEKIIEITNHLNYEIKDALSHEEKIKLSNYNLKAGIRAIAASAYSSAFSFFRKGIEVLPSNAWKSSAKLAIDLYTGYADSAYQIGNYDIAEKSLDYLLSNLDTPIEKAGVIAMRLRQYATIGKPVEAISEGVKALQLLGVKISARPGNYLLVKEIAKARIYQGRRKTSDLIELPVITDSRKKMIARILTEMGAPAYTLGNDNLYGLLALKVVNLSLKYGYTHELPYALVAYGMLQSLAFGNLKAGKEYGELAIELNKKHDDLEYRCRVIAAFGVLTHHWNTHWSNLTAWFRKGIEAGIHSGDVFYLGHSAGNCIIWEPELNIQTKINEYLKYIYIIRETGFADVIDTAEIRLQVLRNLRGETKDRLSLSDKNFDEEKRLQEMQSRNYVSGIAMFHLAKAEVYLMNYDPVNAYEHILEVDKRKKSLVGLNYNVIHSLISFKAASQCYSNATTTTEYMKRMRLELKQMKKWAAYNPENYIHHRYFMEAELLKHTKDYWRATYKYKLAIKHANKNGWPMDVAIYNEAMGMFFESKELHQAASGYFKEAFYHYNRLGVISKVIKLGETYPDCINEAQHTILAGSKTNSKPSTSSSGTSAGALDIDTVIKASQTISSEILLDNLLKKLMKIILENAGAQRGVLLLKNKDGLVIQAENNVETNKIRVLQNIPLQNYQDLPHTLINYVAHTKQSVVLTDACVEGNFRFDSYMIEKKPKSILVEPILKLNRLQGIIFLENNLNTNVFYENRQQLLSILSSQIAISIENSKIFENLEDIIKDRTTELIHANEQLSEKNEQINNQNKALELSNASKDKLFSIIAHDLKSPFNAILGITNVLSTELNNLEQDEIERLAQGLHTTGKKIFTLVENLLSWAMAQTGRIEFQPQNIFFYPIVLEVIELVEESIKAKSLSVTLQIDESLEIFADKNMIFSIMRNLIGNAIKYCETDDKIIISARKNKDAVLISVKDTGVGIKVDKIEKLFEISEDVSTPGTNNEKGTGLGLVICKELIEKHKGEIWVKSEPGEGSDFQFSLQHNFS